MPRIRQGIKDNDFVCRVVKLPVTHKVRANEPGASRDYNPHLSDTRASPGSIPNSRQMSRLFEIRRRYWTK